MCEKGANKPEVVSYYTTIQVIITVAPGNLAGEIYFKFDLGLSSSITLTSPRNVGRTKDI